MEREMRQLLAEIALMATGMHRHQEANTIADGLEASSGSEETVVMIRAMSLMNKGLYEEAHQLLEPLCNAYPDLISLAALASGKAGLLSKAESWVELASQGSEESQAFAASFSQDIRNLG
ncbi:putative type III secretion protein [Vibrio antiquarius]|uniref:Type III secretion protein n=1 Tax=Vibrio antiquarius (strain Ex25) TaxID=150340 RepID=A0ACA6QM67_VIBAE|nr:YscG family type III secretion system chaperone [Vibrio antiquarius]ACY51501.1 putative type III secretion protein [Vibrio antiquarius]